MIVELYRFVESRGQGQSQEINNYTSGQESYIYNSDTYNPKTIGRSRIEDKSEITKNDLTVSLPINDDFAKYFLDDKNTSLTLTIFEYNTVSETADFIFVGNLTDVSVKKQTIALKFGSSYRRSKKSGLNRLIQRSCNHNLYSSACGLNKLDFQEVGIITAISESTGILTIPASTGFDPHYFTYGMIEDLDGVACFPMFHNSTTGEIAVDKIPQAYIDEIALSGSVTIYMYPGCKKTLSECNSRFSNTDNFGGFPFLPATKPFESKRFL